MPLYNCRAFVRDSIRSVIGQSYRDWELIIVDDCSADGSYEAAKAFGEREPRIRVHRLETNSGAAAARNYAIALAEGRYIAFLDSDDLWVPEKLERQLEFMQRRRSALSYTAYHRIDEAGTLRLPVVHVPETITYRGLLKRTVIACLTAMYDTEKLGKRYFDISLKKHEDYQYWLEILKRTRSAEGLDRPLAYYRVRTDSLSSNKAEAALYVWKVQREYQKIPFFQAVLNFISYAFYSVLKRLAK